MRKTLWAIRRLAVAVTAALAGPLPTAEATTSRLAIPKLRP